MQLLQSLKFLSSELAGLRDRPTTFHLYKEGH